MQISTSRGFYCNGFGEWHVAYCLRGCQKIVYLGRDFDSSSASEVSVVIRRLAECRSSGEKIPDSCRQQVMKLPLRIQGTIQRHGLLDEIMDMSIPIDEYLSSRSDVKASTLKGDREWAFKLLEYFKGEFPTSEGVEGFREWCLRTVNECTFSRGYRRCRSIMKFVVEKGYVSKNPFPPEKNRKDANKEKSFTVDYDIVTKILPYCENDYVRLGFILARFAGLRIPSEIKEMRFRDFDNPEFFSVHWKTKTGSRSFPLQKVIREYVEKLRIGKSPSDYVFPERLRKEGVLRNKVKRAILLAGHKVWTKLFINCRATVITEHMSARIADVILDEIFGNSSPVRKKHYWNYRTNIEMQKLIQLGEQMGLIFEVKKDKLYNNQKEFNFDELE